MRFLCYILLQVMLFGFTQPVVASDFISGVKAAQSKEQIKTLLETNDNINQTDESGQNALMWALKESSNPEIIELLLENGADIPLDRFMGDEVYQKIIEDRKMLERSGEKNLDDILFPAKNFLNPVSKSLFYAATYSKSSGIIEWLVQNGANIETRGYDNISVLLHAVKYNSNDEVIEKILELGKYNTRELTQALHLALYHNPNDKITELLIEKGAVVNETWTLPDGSQKITTWKYLNEALFNDNPKVLQVLMKYGIDVSYENETWGSAVKQMAFYNKNPEMLKLVLASGANVNAYSYHETALHSLCKHEYPNVEMLTLLLENGADINAKDRRDRSGETPLMVCSKWNMSADAVKTLLKYGADVNAVDANGSVFLFDLLMIANPDEERTNARLEIIKEAVKYGADVNAKVGNTSLLHYALMENSGSEVIKLLLKNGADYKSVPLNELNSYLARHIGGAEEIKAMYEQNSQN